MDSRAGSGCWVMVNNSTENAPPKTLAKAARNRKDKSLNMTALRSAVMVSWHCSGGNPARARSGRGRELCTWHFASKTALV
jgi:hypothetical protein